MRRAVLLILVATMLLCSCGASPAADFSPTRRETVLAWDDGVMDAPSDYLLGGFHDQVAVMFDLPEWATCITAVQAFVRYDSPFAGSGEVRVRVWAPDEPGEDLPGPIVGSSSEYSLADTTWSWATLPLAMPVGIDDAHFHGERRAFVGLRWETDMQVGVGLDATPPCSGATRFCPWSGSWGRVTDWDAMIRAVVSDEYVDPVEPDTWTRVKALFR